MFSIKIDKNDISKLYLDIVDKHMQNILDTVIKVVDTRPKNKYIIDRKSPYKNYICNQYESKRISSITTNQSRYGCLYKRGYSY